MKTIDDANISGQRVFVRVDFNVPLDENRKITDDARIHAALPTLRHAMNQNAKLIIASHLGRPKGEVNPEYSLHPVAARLGEILETGVSIAPGCVGPEVVSLVDRMKAGDVLLLENLRFHKEEQENDQAFGKALADLCDVYVNDAFAVCHRKHASVHAITQFAPICTAGFLLKKELDYFNGAMQNPVRPLVAVVGGAKISSKLSALKNMLQHVDKIILGGAMANTFIKSEGYDVGKSMIEEELVETAGAVVKTAGDDNIKVYMPVDVVVADQFDPAAETKSVPIQEIPSEWMAMDIGPATSVLFAEALQDAGTVICNGPMGVFEMAAFSRGTYDLIRSIARSAATSIFGGGETGSAVHQAGEADNISYISTGGGAFLTLMEGAKLPAVAALEAAEK